LVTDNILGLPGQQENDILTLARCYNKRRVSRIYSFWLRYYPRIAITEWARREGILSARNYEAILDGKRSAPFSRGGDTSTREFIRLQFLMFLIAVMPAPVIAWIIERRRYRYLPSRFPPAVMAVLTSLFSPALNDHIVHKKELLRYWEGLTQARKTPGEAFVKS
jgi:hypothetical protein